MDRSVEKLLYSRRDTAEALSLSIRSIDYLITTGRLTDGGSVERSLFRPVLSDVSPGKTTQTQSGPASQAVPFTQETGSILQTIHRAASCRKVRGSKAWQRLEQKGLADVPTAGYNLMPPPNTTSCHHPPRSQYAQMPPPSSGAFWCQEPGWQALV